MKRKMWAVFAAILASVVVISSSCAIDYFSIPTASITIDGDLSDWNSVPVAIQDLTNDIYGATYVDIVSVYMAQDTDTYYFRMDMVENLETVQYPCSDWLSFQVNFYGQGVNFQVQINIDPFGNNTGSVQIWDGNMQTTIMQYPASAGFGAVVGNSVEFKALKQHITASLTNVQINGNSWENCQGTNDNTPNVYLQLDGGQGSTGATWYLDYDGDGYGNSGSSLTADSQPAGYVSNSSDCNDNNSSIYPGAYDIPDDGIDQDCDGTDASGSGSGSGSDQTWYYDADGDGYGDATAYITSSSHPVGYVSLGTDCDDTDSSIYPGAAEIAGDGIDQDCDGQDDADSSDSGSVTTDAAKISLLSPANNEAIGFGASGGKVSFSFSKVTDAAKYILYISLTDILNDSGFDIPVELIPPGASSGGGSIWSSGGTSSGTDGFTETFIGMVYELALDTATWDILALYNIQWGVQALDDTGAVIGSTYAGSTPSKTINDLKFIASNSITMVNPSMGDELVQTDAAPTFKWETYQGASSYTLILAHVGSLGFDSVLTMDNLTLNLFPMNDSAWQSMPTGTWYWAVFGYNAAGSQTPSGFTIFDFEVSEY